MEPEAYVKASWQEISMVPLPAFISNTASGYFIALGDRMDEDWSSKGPIHMQGLDKSPVAAAIFMKMVGIW